MATATETGLSQCELEVWLALLRSGAVFSRVIDSYLEAEHGLSLHAFLVLRALADDPQRRLRMSELATRVGLTASGATRLVSGLERSRLVVRTACSEDGRVTYARLTEAGAEKLRAAARTHGDGVRRLLVDRLADGELAELRTLLARLEAGTSDDR